MSRLGAFERAKENTSLAVRAVPATPASPLVATA